MQLKFYGYDKCGTCRKAEAWLKARGVEFEKVAIRETPPTPTELKRMLAAQGGDIRKLFNTSGQDYQALGMKDRIGTMSSEDLLDMLAKQGNLVKRPFVLGPGISLVGFKEEVWVAAFQQR